MSETHASRFTLMRLLSGEVAGPERGQVESHLRGCPACAGELAELESVKAEGQREAPPFRLAQPRPSRPAWFGFALASACAAALVLVLLPRGPGIRSKGGARIAFACKDGPRVWHCKSGERVKPGTAVAVRVELDGPRWLMLLGVDASGQWRTYLPAGGGGAVEVQGGAHDPLGSSLVLDETPGQERFVLVVARRAFGKAELLGGDGGGASLRVPDGFESAELRLEK